MSAVQVGKKIPSFKALSVDGTFSQKDLTTGSISVVYFYPKDDTPGCTKESCEFRDLFPKFKKLEVTVYGVSKDSLKSHEKFKSKHDLPFILISDEEGNMCEKFGVWVEKSMYGKKYMGIERSTFVLDGEGKVLQKWLKVKPEGHAEEVLKFIKSM
jgi:peroxiredoxin Q/BCP